MLAVVLVWKEFCKGKEHNWILTPNGVTILLGDGRSRMQFRAKAWGPRRGPFQDAARLGRPPGGGGAEQQLEKPRGGRGILYPGRKYSHLSTK